MLKILLASRIATINDRVLRATHPQLKLAFRIESHLTIAERVKLFDLARNCSNMAEIGSYVGASACVFGAALAIQGTGKLICIDTWKNDAMSEGPKDTWTDFLKNTFRYKEFIVPMRGLSTEVIDLVRAVAPFLDLLFIDGDHSYGGVRADWNTYKAFLKPGSIVVFHDYGWADGVRQVVHHDVAPLVSTHGSLPNMWWGTIGSAP